MKHDEPQSFSNADLHVEFESGIPDKISRALTIAALHSPDRAYVEDLIVRFIRHSDPWVRGVAAICAGHVARIHRQLSQALVPLIEELVLDPRTSGNAQDALEDIKMFVGGHTPINEAVSKDQPPTAEDWNRQNIVNTFLR